MFKIGDSLQYAGTVATIAQVFTNAVVLRRASGAQFTVLLTDKQLAKSTEAEIDRECAKVDAAFERTLDQQIDKIADYSADDDYTDWSMRQGELGNPGRNRS